MSPSSRQQASGAIGYVPQSGMRDKPKRKVINVSNTQSYKNSKDIVFSNNKNSNTNNNNNNNSTFDNKNPYL